MHTTILETRKILVKSYVKCSLFQYYLAILRLYVCPFHKLLDWVPDRSSILDVGCGTGIFLNLTAAFGRLSKGVGIDAAKKSIETARNAFAEIESSGEIEFLQRQVEQGLPDGKFDVVSMVDVMHHINPDHQQEALITAATRVNKTGTLIYKDMVIYPRWRAWANRIHDLIVARQWIHYVPAATIVSWMEANHFRLRHKETINMLWYGHELLIFQRSED